MHQCAPQKWKDGECHDFVFSSLIITPSSPFFVSYKTVLSDVHDMLTIVEFSDPESTFVIPLMIYFVNTIRKKHCCDSTSRRINGRELYIECFILSMKYLLESMSLRKVESLLEKCKISKKRLLYLEFLVMRCLEFKFDPGLDALKKIYDKI
jgi:hypothetical protein